MTVETKITGREPRLAINNTKQGKRRLSLRHLATMLNVLPPEAISLDAAAEMLRNGMSAPIPKIRVIRR